MRDKGNRPRSRGAAGYATPRAVLLCDCGHETEIVNSRGTERGDVIRRQRACKSGCEGIFTTYESRTNPAIERRATALLEAAVDAIQATLAELKRR